MRHYTYFHFDELDSTSTYLKRNYESLKSFTVVSCNHQSQGKGRLGRGWDDDSNSSLLMSILIKDDFSFDLSKISLLVGASIHQTLRKLGINCKIKWPNDILINDKKVAGILCEMVVDNKKMKALVIGIGLNINNKNFPQTLKNKATSLYLSSSNLFDIEKIKKSIIKEFDSFLTKYLNNNLQFIKICQNNSYLDNKEVVLNYYNENIKGVVKRIDEEGNLIIQKQDDIVKVTSGEVSLTDVYKQ